MIKKETKSHGSRLNFVLYSSECLNSAYVAETVTAY